MDKFFTPDPAADGVKGLVFIGDKLLVYRRDTNTAVFPLHIDLPGGGIEDDETPFEAFRRETKEEFNISLQPSDITYVRHYPFTTIKTSTVSAAIAEYFPVAHLPAGNLSRVTLGDEGTEYMLMTLDGYLRCDEAIPVFQQRARHYSTTAGPA